MTDLRFPIGQFKFEDRALSDADRASYIDQIARTPRRLREAVRGLTDEQLDTPYRPGGWTVRQVIHHVPDSHLNSYVRFKLALTEDEPVIKPYDEAGWAALADSRSAPVEASLGLLDSLHERWVLLLKSIAPSDFARSFNHPERGRVSLDANLALYAWHGKHHVAHITSLRERMGWAE
ncbi:MAG TPA: putative metal-dependent hydrolase [Blastocatellia bacterium]|nr:putative metal-dependent hydrolase [Blastocatellia bacterium]